MDMFDYDLYLFKINQSGWLIDYY